MPVGDRTFPSDAPRQSVPERRFWVIWQDPDTRRLVPVAQLEIFEGPQYVFQYLLDAELAEGFEGFPAFPDLHRTYRSAELWPFFTNRVMSARRPDFEEYASALGLVGGEATPVELLARSAGIRATDTIQVVPAPLLHDGRAEVPFLVSGCRHLAGAEHRIAALRTGQELELRDEPDNQADTRAVLLDVSRDEPVGWMPSYLLDDVHKFRDSGAEVRVTVEKANGPGVPWHLRLLGCLTVDSG